MRKRIQKLLQRSNVVRQMPGLDQTYRLQKVDAIELAAIELVFVPIPKVANRSMKLALAKRMDMDLTETDVHHLAWTTLTRRELSASPYFRFAFVRHPLDRLLSCYTQKVSLNERERQGPAEFWRYGNRFWKDMSFAEFVHAVARVPDSRSDVHFRSQHTFITDPTTGEVALEFVGRFDQLSSDWQRVGTHFDLPALPHTNRSSHEDWQLAYTDELRQIAEQRYDVDMQLFEFDSLQDPS